MNKLMKFIMVGGCTWIFNIFLAYFLIDIIGWTGVLYTLVVVPPLYLTKFVIYNKKVFNV